MKYFVILVAVLLSVEAATVPPVITHKVSSPLPGHGHKDTEVPAVVVEVNKNHKHNQNVKPVVAEEHVPEVVVTTVKPMATKEVPVVVPVDIKPEVVVSTGKPVVVEKHVPEVVVTTVEPMVTKEVPVVVSVPNEANVNRVHGVNSEHVVPPVPVHPVAGHVVEKRSVDVMPMNPTVATKGKPIISPVRTVDDHVGVTTVKPEVVVSTAKTMTVKPVVGKGHVPEIVVTTVNPMVTKEMPVVVPVSTVAAKPVVSHVVQKRSVDVMPTKSTDGVTTVKPDIVVSTVKTMMVEPVVVKEHAPEIVVTTVKPMVKKEVPVPIDGNVNHVHGVTSGHVVPSVVSSVPVKPVVSHVVQKRSVDVMPTKSIVGVTTVKPDVVLSTVKTMMVQPVVGKEHVPEVVVTTVNPMVKKEMPVVVPVVVDGNVNHVDGVTSTHAVPSVVSTVPVKPVVGHVVQKRSADVMPMKPEVVVSTVKNMMETPVVVNEHVPEVVVTTVTPMVKKEVPVVVPVPIGGNVNHVHGVVSGHVVPSVVPSVPVKPGVAHVVQKRPVDVMPMKSTVGVTTVKPEVVVSTVKTMMVQPVVGKEHVPEVVVTTVKPMVTKEMPVVVPVPTGGNVHLSIQDHHVVNPGISDVVMSDELIPIPVRPHLNHAPGMPDTVIQVIAKSSSGNQGHTRNRRSVEAVVASVKMPEVMVSTVKPMMKDGVTKVPKSHDTISMESHGKEVTKVGNKVPSLVVPADSMTKFPNTHMVVTTTPRNMVEMTMKSEPNVDHKMMRRSVEMVTTMKPMVKENPDVVQMPNVMVTTDQAMIKNVDEVVTTVKPMAKDVTEVVVPVHEVTPVVKDSVEGSAVPNMKPKVNGETMTKEVPVQGTVVESRKPHKGTVTEKISNDALPPILHHPVIKDEVLVPHVSLSPPITEDVKDKSSDEDSDEEEEKKTKKKKDNKSQEEDSDEDSSDEDETTDKNVKRPKRAQPFWDKQSLVTAKPKLVTDPKVIANILTTSKPVKLNHRVMRSVNTDNMMVTTKTPIVANKMMVTTTKPVDEVTTLATNIDRCDLLCTKFEIDPVCATNGICMHEFPNKCMLETYNCRHPKNKFVVTRDHRCPMIGMDVCTEVDLE
ncbi:uncharacterized protein LOC142234443 [Haematobia irritans]|uniref:uncharacterized protein LOC142234443 n=1 Tax=Haematobia irritans TaxID=7368 RepID=UPI003F4F8BB6